ncbi:MAG: hypothetical protein IKN54_04905 [Lachnospiraceae bacterium]|nr:hypothetical protein [Lachnospiraceae bacterium]
MKYISKLFVPIILLSLAFLITAEMAIEELGSDITYGSDFKFCINIEDSEENKNLTDYLEYYSNSKNVRIASVGAASHGWRNVCVDIICNENSKEYFAKSNHMSGMKHTFYSIISGKNTVEIKNLGEGENECGYYFFGGKEDFDELMGVLKQNFDMTYYGRTDKRNAQAMQVMCIWFVTSVIICLYMCYFNGNEKRRIYIKYINGVSRIKQILFMIFQNIVSLGLIFIVIKSVVSLYNSVDYTTGFYTKCYGMVILITSLHILSFLRYDIKKILSKERISRGILYTMEVSSLVIIILYIICISVNIKTINDEYRVVGQEKMWKDMDEYSSYFVQSDLKHFERIGHGDNMTLAKLYEQYIDEYEIRLNIDIFNNGAHSKIETTINDPVIYANKYCIDQIKKLDGVGNLEDKYYIISKYSKEQLNSKGILNLIEEHLGYTDDELIIIQMKKDFTWNTYDIQLDNLADNCKNNPVILFDNTGKLIKNTVWVAGYYRLALAKFKTDNDFESFLLKHDYKDSDYSTYKVLDMYEEASIKNKASLLLNLVLTAMMLLLFNVIVSSLFKMEFDANAIEISVNKILGQSLLKRYRKIVVISVLGVFISIGISIYIAMKISSFKMSYYLVSGMILALNMWLILAIFIRRYESKSIVKVLKGGGI